MSVSTDIHFYQHEVLIDSSLSSCVTASTAHRGQGGRPNVLDTPLMRTCSIVDAGNGIEKLTVHLEFTHHCEFGNECMYLEMLRMEGVIVLVINNGEHEAVGTRGGHS